MSPQPILSAFASQPAHQSQEELPQKPFVSCHSSAWQSEDVPLACFLILQSGYFEGTAQTSGLHMGRLAFQASLFPSPSTPQNLVFLSLCLKWFCLSISKPGQKFLLGALERACILLPTQMCSISTHLVYTLSQTGRKKTGFFFPLRILSLIVRYWSSTPGFSKHLGYSHPN